MEREPNPEQTSLTGIHINLAASAIEFEDRYGTIGRLRFTGATVLYEGAPLLLTPSVMANDPIEPDASLRTDQSQHPHRHDGPIKSSLPITPCV